MKHKIIFLCPPIVLAIVTCTWLFYKDGRWYTYRQEWPWYPLLFLHLALPLFYLIAFIVVMIRHFNKAKRSSSDTFYIVTSIVMNVICCIGLLVFMIFTSGM